ncbi:MAG: hypothetical protein L7G96_06665 [Vulcanisaeta sp.]|nr:hypothetical protein [Vulcanisaeta sp.]
MDITKVMSLAVLALVLVLAAVVTYYVLSKFVAPPSKLHKGPITVVLPIGTAPYQQEIPVWPPYFQLTNASQIYLSFVNYSLIYGPDNAPIKVLIIYNPVMPPATNFTVLNTDYILNTAKSGLAQYEIVFNVVSFSPTLTPTSPLALAELNVASVAYCLYYNFTDKDYALLFLKEVGSYVGSNTTNIVNLTSIATVQGLLDKLRVSINASACVGRYEHFVLDPAYQYRVLLTLMDYYVPPQYTPNFLTGTSPVNSPIIFILGYNSLTGAYDSTLNNLQLSTLIQNLMMQKFMYEKSTG